MSGRLLLAQPVSCKVDMAGCLIQADEPLRRLHIMAGGIEGGQLAIPALARLVGLTSKTKMRFARAVNIASREEDIDAWVETKFEDGIVTLSILSWRSTPGVAVTDPSGMVGAAVRDGKLVAQFDADHQLIMLQGDVPDYFERNNIGRHLLDVIEPRVDDRQRLIEAITSHARFVLDDVVLAAGHEYQIIGEPDFADTGAFAGFRCELFVSEKQSGALVSTVNAATLFGQQLAPALRQPLGRIIANAETIGSKLQGPIRENYSAYAKDIADAARHLVTLVDDLGDLEAVERADFSTAKDKIELGDIARRVAGLLALKAADHQIVLHTPQASETVSAIAEFRRVLQIMLNLVTNAVRYSPDGSNVYIEIAETNNNATISVSDEGAGIYPQNREKIFEKFERLGRSGDGGSGLGLYISRRLARFMGGDLIVGETEKGGSKFTLSLPKS